MYSNVGTTLHFQMSELQMPLQCLPHLSYERHDNCAVPNFLLLKQSFKEHISSFGVHGLLALAELLVEG